MFGRSLARSHFILLLLPSVRALHSTSRLETFSNIGICFLVFGFVAFTSEKDGNSLFLAKCKIYEIVSKVTSLACARFCFMSLATQREKQKNKNSMKKKISKNLSSCLFFLSLVHNFFPSISLSIFPCYSISTSFILASFFSVCS